MVLAEAKEYIGQVCSINYKDRSGNEKHIVSKIYDATYVPLYGGYVVTDTDDIRLDRICDMALFSAGATAVPASSALTAEPVAA